MSHVLSIAERVVCSLRVAVYELTVTQAIWL